MALTKNFIPIDQGKLTKFMQTEAAREMRPALVRHGITLLDLHFKSAGRTPAKDYAQEVEATVNELLDAGNDSAQCVLLLDKSIKSMIDGAAS